MNIPLQTKFKIVPFVISHSEQPQALKGVWVVFPDGFKCRVYGTKTKEQAILEALDIRADGKREGKYE